MTFSCVGGARFRHNGGRKGGDNVLENINFVQPQKKALCMISFCVKMILGRSTSTVS